MEARASEAPATAQVTVIEPPQGWSFPNLREIAAHRDLVYYLARRDVVVRYKQAAVGGFWVVIQPLLLAGVFSLFLGRYAGVPSDPGIPYPLFALTGMVIWLMFATMLDRISQSTISSESLISKIYFPRVVIPIAAVIPPLVDFALTFVVLLLVALAYGVAPGWQILAAPFVVGLAALTALGAGLWLSALNVKYRDVTLVVPFALLVGLFITPILYPFDVVPESVQPLFALNPMVGVIEGFRWSVLGTDFPGALLLVPVLISVVLIVTGALYFQRAQKSFADVI
jgi:lipopolysaccharide transport system permease protein